MKDHGMEKAIRRVLTGGEACRGADCPDENRIAAYLDGRLPPQEREGLEAHAAGCGSCRRILALSMQLEPEPVADEPFATAPERKVLFHFTIPVSAIALFFVATALAVLFYRLNRSERPAAPVAETARLEMPMKMEAVPTRAPVAQTAPSMPAKTKETAGGARRKEPKAAAPKQDLSLHADAVEPRPALDRPLMLVGAPAEASLENRAALPAAAEVNPGANMMAARSMMLMPKQSPEKASKTIGDKTFSWVSGVWVDGECSGKSGVPPVELKPGSAALEEVLKAFPGLEELHPVIICLQGKKLTIL